MSSRLPFFVVIKKYFSINYKNKKRRRTFYNKSFFILIFALSTVTYVSSSWAMDIFQISEGGFNPVLLLPVLVVVIGAVAVFVFGFKKPTNPKFRKIGNEHSNVGAAGSINSSNKKQKRNVTAEATSAHQQLKPLVTTKAPHKKEATVAPANEAKTIAALNNKNKTQSAAKTLQTKKAAAAAAKINAKEHKSNAKNAEKPLDDGGEWHTVVTKKQKKTTATTNDLLIQAVAEAAAGASLKKSGAHEKKNLLKPNNNKQAKEQANKTKKATVEYQRVKDYNNIVDNKSLEEKLETANNIVAPPPAADETSIPEVLPELYVDAAPPPEKPQTAVVDKIAVYAAEEFTPLAEDTNLIFDELGGRC